MPKIVTPSMRNALSLAGLVNKHDSMLDQPLLTTSNVTFNNMELTGNLTVLGNTLIQGQQTILETQIVRTQDAIIEVNYDNTSPLTQGGIQINRGPGLAPALIVWDEASQTVQVGATGSLHPVAYRSLTNMDGGIVIWNESTQTMAATNTVSIDTTFNGHVYAQQGIGLGSSPSPPFVTGDSLGNMVFQTNSNVQFNLNGATGQVIFGALTKLNFGGQTSLYADTLGTMYLNALAYRLPVTSQLGWSAANYITSSQDGNTMRFVAPNIEFAASQSMNVPVPLNFGTTGTISAQSASVLEISSTGDISLVPGPSGVVRIPSLSINNNMVQFLSDPSGNFTLQTAGNITFNPLANINVPSGKQLIFSTQDKSLYASTNGDLTMTSAYNIVLNPVGNIIASSQLQVRSYTTINEDGSGNTIFANNNGNILLQPLANTGYVGIPVGTHLYFSTSESMYSNGQNLYLISGLDIVFSAGRNLLVPQNKLLSFGNASNGILLNSAGTLAITANLGILLAANVTVGGSLTWENTGSSITENSTLGSLVLSAPNNVTSTAPFLVTSTASGSTIGTAALNVSGSMVTTGVLVGQSNATFTGNLTAANGALSTSNTLGLPVLSLQNPSTTIGDAITIKTSWDTTAGYTIGHGTSTLNGGRVLSFTVPDYAIGYGSTGARPSVYFGTTNTWILTVSDILTTLRSGDMLISSTSNTALQVAGTTQTGSLVSQSLSIPNVISINTSGGIQANGFMSANAGFQVYGTSVQFSVSQGQGVVANLPVYINNTAQFTSNSTFNGAVLASNDLTVQGVFSVAGGRVQNVGTPTVGTDAATKSYVDMMAQGMSFKTSVTAASTANINLAGPVYNLDGVTLTSGMRVLIKDQTNAVENGIYVVNSDFTLVRSSDFAVGEQAAGSIVFVSEGTQFSNEGFIVSGSNLIVGTDVINWTSFIGLDVIQTSTALSKTGNVLSVLIDSSSIETNSSNQLRIASGAVGTGLVGGSGIPLATSSNQSHVTQVGTISQGTWNGSTISTAYGGTGLTSVGTGQVLFGGSSTVLNTGNVFYDTLANHFGIGTTTPTSTLHVSESVTNVALQLVSSNATPQQVGIVFQQTGTPSRQSQVALLTDGTLLLSQDDSGTDSRIVLATGGGNSRVIVNSSGQVLIGTTSPDGSNVLTIGGSVSISTTASIAGSLALGNYATFASHPTYTTDLLVTTPTMHLSGGFQAAANSTIGNLQFQTSSSSTTLLSADATTGIALPLNFAQSSSFISATAYGSGFHVPSILLLGGSYLDQTTGYRAQLISNNLHFTPGASTMQLIMDGLTVFGKGFNIYDNSNTANVSNTLSIYASANTTFINASSASMNLDIGVGGASETVTTIGNAAGNNYIQFDPTAVGGGTFTISAPTSTMVRGDMTLYKSLFDAISLGTQATLSNIGWYYLGQLGVGKMTVQCSLSWTAIITYDGVSARSVSLDMRNRNDASLVIYKVGIAQYVFIHVWTSPVQVHIYESSQAVRLDQYEGSSSNAPDGTYSAYDSTTWVLDYDTHTAQGTATTEIGSLTANVSANINNLTASGPVTIGGTLSVNGNTTYTGTDHLWQLTSGNLAELKSDANQNNSFTVYAADGSSSTLNLNRTSQTASISVSSLFALQYPGALTISHNTASSNSKIILATQAQPRMIVSDAGQVSILSTTDTTGQNDGALVVFGGVQVTKSITSLSQVICPQLVLKNIGSGVLTTLSTSSSGDLYLSGQRIVSLGTPQNANDAVNKAYVDLAVQGMAAKAPVVAASAGTNYDVTQQISSMDGVSIAVGARILLKDQTNAVENGVYVNGAPPTRSTDMASGSNASGSTVFVNQGTINANSGWVCNTAAGQDVVGVNALSFSQFSGAGQLLVGPGLTKNGNEIDLVPDNYSIEVALGAIRIKSSTLGTGLSGGSGQPITVSSITHLNALGTISQGTWQAGIIDMQYGGTGAAAFSANSIPFSNGLQLTQGPLVFDSVNIRLGINTTTPTQGFTMLDRNILLSQTGSSPCYFITTSIASNFSFAQRQSGTQLIWSSGTGQDPTALTDCMYLDQTGVLNTTFGIVTPFATVNSSYRFTGNANQRLTSGVMNMSYYSSDNTGTYLTLYGGVGTFGNTTNSELMRVGYYNGSYVVATSATGTGISRSLILQTGGVSNQLVLASSGGVTVNDTLSITNTTDATSVTSGGALTVSGGCAVNGKLYTQELHVMSSSSTAFSLAGGFSLSSPLTLVGLATYNFASNNGVDAIQFTSTTSGTPTALHISTFDANATLDSKIRLFAVGTDQSTSSTADWLSLGFDVSSSTYHCITKAQTHGTLRSLGIGVGNVQLLFANSGASFTCPISTSYPVTVTATSDAASSTSGGAFTISGGLAVAKSLIVGASTTSSVLQITDHQEFSQAGSADRIFVRYMSTGTLHYYNSSMTNLHIHGGASGGPTSTNQEYLSIGYLDSSNYAITTGQSGTGTLSALVLQAGNNTGQLVLATNGQITMSGSLNIYSTADATSTTTGSLITSGGIGIAGHMFVGNSVSVTADVTTGNLLVLTSTLTTWSLVADTVNSLTTLRSAAATDVFAIGGPSATMLKLDPNAGAATISLPTFVNASSNKAFSVQNGSGIDVFFVDTVNTQVNMGGGQIINLADPTTPDGAATKRYVDNVAKGLNLKYAVMAASTAGLNVNLSNPLTSLDGVTLAVGYRILLKDQTNAVQNGIYVVTTGNYLVRSDDMAIGSRAAGAFCFIEEGSTHADTGYVCTADYPNDVVGTDPIQFTQFNGNIISTGLGLYKDANNVLNVNLDTYSGLGFNAGALRVDPSFAGNGLQLTNGVLSAIPSNTLGTVTVGVWHATPVELAYGGTGNTNFTNGAIVFSTGTSLVGDGVNLFWDSSKKALGIGTNLPDPNSLGEGLTTSKNIAIYNTTAGMYLGANSAYNWAMHRVDDGQGTGAAHMFFSGGASSTTLAGLVDVLVLTSGGKVGIGYSTSTVNNISATLDVTGTMHITGSVALDTALTIANGGTGTANLPYGLVIGHGTGALTTTGVLPDGGVAIGDSTGAIVVESGSTLRAHLGLAIGTNVQSWNANLDAISGLTPSSNYFIVGNGTNFTTIAGAAVRSAIGLGTLAVLNTIDDSLWSGAQLSVAHGGTGATSFTNGSLPYYNPISSTLSSSSTYWDATNNGLGIGINTITAGNLLQVYAGDVAIQTSDNVNGNYGINFQNVNGQYVWRIRRQDAGAGNGSANLVFAGGVPNASKTTLTDTLALMTTGVVEMYSTIDSTLSSNGALVVRGGVGVAKTVMCGSTALDSSHTLINGSATKSTLTIQNGVSSGQSCIAFIDNTNNSQLVLGYDNGNSVSFVSATGALHISTNTLTLTATTTSTSANTGALVISGGLGVGSSTNMGGNVSTSIPTTGTGTYLTVASGVTFTNTATIASGTSNDYNAIVLGQSTLASTNTGITTSNATTLFIAGAPLAGTNTTIGDRYAMWIATDVARFDGNVTIKNTTNSTSGSTGALNVAGGVGVTKDLIIGGVITQTSGTSTISYIDTQNVQFTGTNTSALKDGVCLEVVPTTIQDGVTLSGSTIAYSALQTLSSSTLNAVNTNITVTQASTLHVVGAPTAGTNVTITTGRAVHVESGVSEFGGQVVITDTTDSSGTSTGALVVAGGAAFDKTVYAAGDLYVNGVIWASQNVTAPTIVPSNLSNVGSVVVGKSKLIRDGHELSFKCLFEVIPSTGSVLSSFTFTLPSKASNLVNAYDVITFTDGWTGGTALVKVGNTVCAGVSGTPTVVVQFEAASSSAHYISVQIEYNDA